MDYAKRAAEIAATDYVARASGCLLHWGSCRYLLGKSCNCDRREDVESVADALRGFDMVHLAELQAAHDAGVAEAMRKCASELRVFMAMEHVVPDDVAAFLQALPSRWERTEPGAVGEAAPGDGTVERRAPMQGEHGKNKRPGGTIAWSEHMEIYEAYAKRYGRDQSAERLAERGGFGWNECVLLLGREPTTWQPRDGR